MDELEDATPCDNRSQLQLRRLVELRLEEIEIVLARCAGAAPDPRQRRPQRRQHAEEHQRAGDGRAARAIRSRRRLPRRRSPRRTTAAPAWRGRRRRTESGTAGDARRRSAPRSRSAGSAGRPRSGRCLAPRRGRGAAPATGPAGPAGRRRRRWRASRRRCSRADRAGQASCTLHDAGRCAGRRIACSQPARMQAMRSVWVARSADGAASESGARIARPKPIVASARPKAAATASAARCGTLRASVRSVKK